MAQRFDVEQFHTDFARFASSELQTTHPGASREQLQKLLNTPQVKLATIALMQFYVDDTRREYCEANKLPIHFTPSTTTLEERLNVLQAAVGHTITAQKLILPDSIYNDINLSVRQAMAEPLYDMCKSLAEEHNQIGQIQHEGRVQKHWFDRLLGN